ncbi:ADR035Cp [Eremothecium gossypii ATCC 10895]|uniref:Multiple RNA-binding domain-containing protein 1 n=1 Tax=Eremothecium gossypii (strain ATCC 10895 / CBS 109.51 / FGSC 9923 / NRRL Y-1056) TaxID=284811 RepID=MRD1_EREGS|nr:ADR035Cp [Eremothecium gossypii ATCC 10895]Q75A83.2 RecName: Full=Multiple RNA-binding domain-containing protein 1 [Eremothecium gossypii ATCC 10895]AAS51955.2 ADR035Cp [Eremothecium gossypii ATCC 10895]AEY96255.1 FADR035Cp [Eremothecium gossypii FDAG1]
MSRVIVKGLPIYLEEARLRAHFLKRLQQQGRGSEDQITDVKIVKDKSGNSRRFAFIGYRSEQDAFDAIEYFNGSFIDTARIEVAMAKSFADPRVPTPMREKRREALKRLREREDRILAEKRQKQTKPQHGIDAEISKNKQLQEFIETMNPKMAAAAANPMARAAEQPASANPLLSALHGAEDDEEVDMFQLSEQESDDEYTDLHQRPQSAEEDELEEPAVGQDLDAAPAPDAAEDGMATNQEVSDLEWLKNRRIRIRDGEDAEAAPAPQEQAAEEPAEQEVPQEDEVSAEEAALTKIRATGRLFLRNILYDATEEDFKQLFSPYGELEEVHVAVDTRTGQSKGFAYVLFKDPEHAANAYIELDKQIFQGRLLHILPADAKKTHRLDEFDLKNLPLKKQRELKRKATAAQQTFSWNSLFMNQDAVLSSVAAKLGMEKSQLIDPENSGSAVKQALAEAHVIGDVRKYFEARGVDLTQFEKFKKVTERDDRIILVKNFPHGTTREELAELFLPFGKIERLLMPPSGTIAIIQYRDVPAARGAFTKLSYKRFKEAILYLEKGPKDCFSREPRGDELLEGDAAPEDVKEIKKSVEDVMDADSKTPSSEATAIDGPTVSIFVKNLNFSTTSAQLAEKFKPFSGFVVAQVKTKPDPKNSDKKLSMGFGFIEFRTKEQAGAVIAAMDGAVIDGHKIQLKISHKQSSLPKTSKGSKKKISGKIIVKNLPFEATRKDVFELFSSFGQLKSVRVPKKFDKSARGFAFVEFLLPSEAENAMDQLQGVHLLGRRLVMQYAEQESDDVEEQISKMTMKMKKQAAVSKMGALRNSGKRKIDMSDDENDGLNGF